MSAGTTPETLEHSNTVLRWLTVAAVAGLALAYIHAELYTVYGPHVLLEDWRLTKYWNYLLGMLARPGYILKLRDWGPLPPWAQLVYILRWPARALGAICLSTLVFFECRYRAVGDWMRACGAKQHRTIGALILLGVLSGFYFLLPGYITAAIANGEYYTHLAWLIKDAVEHGGFPIWTNWGAMGFPLMQFYSPLFFTVTAFMNYVIPNIWVAIKVVFLLLHIASVVAMYFLVHRVTASRSGAFVAAFAYAFAYYRYHTIVFLNKFVLAPTFLIWPLQLYLVERLLAGRGSRRAGIALALVSAAGLTAHINFGIHGVIFAAIYGIVRIASSSTHELPARKRTATMLRMAFWFGLGVLASLFYTLPIALESNLTVIPWWYGAGYCAPSSQNQTLIEKVAATFTFTGDWQWGYAGRIVFALAIIGLIAALLRRKGYGVALLTVLSFSLFMTWGPYSCLFSAQGQYLVYAVIIATVGVGVFVVEVEQGQLGTLISRLTTRLSGIAVPHASQWTTVIVLVLVAFDMLRYLLFVNYFIPPTPYGSPASRVAAHQWLVEHRGEISGRVLDPSQPENGWQIPMIAGIPTFQDNGDSQVYSAALLRNLRPLGPNPQGLLPYSVQDLFGPSFSLLLLANVDWVIADRPTPLESLPDVVVADEHSVLVPTGGGLPMLASRTARVVTPPPQMASLAADIQIERERASAAFLPVRAEVPSLDVPEANGEPLTLRMHEHHMESQYVRLDYVLSEAAYVQLSYSYYPYLRITIDSTEVEKFPTTFGLIGVISPAGRHTIEIVPYLSPLRKVVGVINVGILLLLAALLVSSYHRQRTSHGEKSAHHIARQLC